MIDSRFDVIVIGAGIIGLSVALEATTRFPHLRLAVFEKEPCVAGHQSSRNSGVIHSGIYYRPGSRKARMCVEGAAAMVDFCQRHGIPHRLCGKVIVATSEAELPRLDELLHRGVANSIPGLAPLGPEQLREIEPRSSGIRALHVPGTGITEYSAVSQKYAELMTGNGGQLLLSAKVTRICKCGGEIIVETSRGAYACGFLINCAGLHSDRISRMAGQRPEIMIVPFRGEYYELVPERDNLVKGLIYPVPDPSLPFLGVHFTRRVSGRVEAGPNAVLAFRREGYHPADVNPRDVLSMLTFPGFWRMGAKYWRTAVDEFHRSLSKKAFLRALQRLLPELQSSDLHPGGSGVRAQGVRRDGSLVDDFEFVRGEKMLHICNVPSPAATASIPIGRAIVDMVQEQLDLSPKALRANR